MYITGEPIPDTFAAAVPFGPTVKEILELCRSHVDKALSLYGNICAGTKWRYSLDLRFNASVQDSVPPTYTLGFGTGIAIFDVCMTLACNSAFCEDIPIDSEIVSAPNSKDHEARYWDYSYLMVDGKTAAIPCTKTLDDPFCHRANMAMKLFESAVQFLVLHELMHHTEGHLRFLQRTMGLREFTEIGRPAALSDDSVHFTLESVADQDAARRLFSEAFPQPAMYSTEAELANATELSLDRTTRQSLLGIAIVLALFERGDRMANGGTPTRTHPSAATRIVSVLATLCYEWLRRLAAPIILPSWIWRADSDVGTILMTLNCAPMSDMLIYDYASSSDRRAVADRPEVRQCTAIIKQWMDISRVIEEL